MSVSLCCRDGSRMLVVIQRQAGRQLVRGCVRVRHNVCVSMHYMNDVFPSGMWLLLVIDLFRYGEDCLGLLMPAFMSLSAICGEALLGRV